MLERDPHDAQGALGRLERGADDDLNELLARPGVGSPEAQLQIDPDRVEQRRAANRRPPLELSEVGEQVCRAARPEGGPEFVGVRRGSALGVGARVEEQLVGQGIRHEPAERSAGEHEAGRLEVTEPADHVVERHLERRGDRLHEPAVAGVEGLERRDKRGQASRCVCGHALRDAAKLLVREAGEDGLPKRFPGALATFAAGEKPAADDGLQWGVRGRVRQPARALAVLAGG